MSIFNKNDSTNVMRENPYGDQNLFGLGNPYGNGFFEDPYRSLRMNGGGTQFQQKKETYFSKVLLIVSLIAAVLFFMIGEIIYRVLITNVNSVFFMGAYYAAFGMILALCLLIAARIIGMEITLRRLVVVGLCILFLLIFGTLFEFLYELNIGSVKVATDNYIFAIDNSGSMEQNDPDQKRVDAVKQLLKNCDEDVEFAVYTFSNTIQCLREMGAVSEGIGDLLVSPEGGTPIIGVLSQIMNDMESGTLTYDEGSQVILLTDGYATDNEFFNFKLNSVLKKYNKKKVSISTVGLGYVDDKMLNNISGKTGGISVTTDNVDQLGSAMVSAVRVTDSTRNLLSSRARTNYNWLYAIMRIVFITILGLAFLGIKIAITDESANAKMIILSSTVGIVLGALIMEIGLSLILSEFLSRLLLVILFSLLFTTIEKTLLITRNSDIGQLGWRYTS